MIGYFVAATMLAVASDGVQRRLSIDGIGARVYQHRFGKRNPRDVMDAMEKMKLFIGVWTGSRNRGSLSERPPSDGPPGWAVRSASGRCGSLPEEIDGRVFRLGATFNEQSSHESICGFYGVTSDVSKAVVGIYLPKGLEVYPSPKAREGTKRERSATDEVRNSKERRAKRHPQPTTEDEHREILATEPTRLLNSQGSPTEVVVTCPRMWRIFHERPPHISAISWAAITPVMRAHHIRCLQKLQMMPAALLNQSIASTVIECTRREAVAAGWKPPTIDKELSTMAGALRDLPLYTSESQGILLRKDPEWVSAVKAMKRLVREHKTSPPDPVTWEQCQSAQQELNRKSPMAALFLAMAWSLAARSGDVASLRRQDVSLETKPRADGTYGLAIVQKYGKGTRFRGTYAPASTLPRENALELQRLLNRRRPKQRLFVDPETLKDQVRAALRMENRMAALPSIRKGAIRHLAKQGVPEETIMRLTGHTRLETLHTYLGYGHPTTQEAAAAQASAGLLHHPGKTNRRVHRRRRRSMRTLPFSFFQTNAHHRAFRGQLLTILSWMTNQWTHNSPHLHKTR